MAGWLDWFEEVIKCPCCGAHIIVLFCEDGNPNRDPVVIIAPVNEVLCKNCGNKVEEKDINQQIT